MRAITLETHAMFIDLPGLLTLVWHQHLYLKGLVEMYVSMAQMEGPLEEEQYYSERAISG